MKTAISWVALLSFIGLLLFAVSKPVKVNHDTIPVLADVVPTWGGNCTFNKKGQMLKGGEVAKPCLIGISQSTGKWYAIIQSEDGMITEVIEMDTDKVKNTSVWKEKPKPPKGQLGV